MLGLFAVVSVVTLINVWGLVMMRRRDFGRRRALGATRLTIVVLVLTQILATATVGVVTGTSLGTGWLAAQGQPHPSLRYVLAVAVALVVSAGAAAAIPAALAARRDPLHELRVP